MSLDELQPEFGEKLYKVLDRCRTAGVVMQPYSGLRSPYDQARLWRQSRTRTEIEQRIIRLRLSGAAFLAHCIESVGPQFGKPVTSAIPGLSWHQWGEAVDCYWVVDGRSEWSPLKKIRGQNGYGVFTQELHAAGLDAGGSWVNARDWPHAQLHAVRSPLKRYSLADIDHIMRERFE